MIKSIQIVLLFYVLAFKPSQEVICLLLNNAIFETTHETKAWYRPSEQWDMSKPHMIVKEGERLKLMACGLSPNGISPFMITSEVGIEVIVYLDNLNVRHVSGNLGYMIEGSLIEHNPKIYTIDLEDDGRN